MPDGSEGNPKEVPRFQTHYPRGTFKRERSPRDFGNPFQMGPKMVPRGPTILKSSPSWHAKTKRTSLPSLDTPLQIGPKMVQRGSQSPRVITLVALDYPGANRSCLKPPLLMDPKMVPNAPKVANSLPSWHLTVQRQASLAFLERHS